MSRTEFIQVQIKTSHEDNSIQFINRNHIQRVYTESGNVYIEMTDYTTFHVDIDNIYTFMDRFID
jgi:hypothetical protein